MVKRKSEPMSCYNFHKMQVGERRSFYIVNRYKPADVSNAAYVYAHRSGKKFKCRNKPDCIVVQRMA